MEKMRSEDIRLDQGSATVERQKVEAEGRHGCERVGEKVLFCRVETRSRTSTLTPELVRSALSAICLTKSRGTTNDSSPPHHSCDRSPSCYDHRGVGCIFV